MDTWTIIKIPFNREQRGISEMGVIGILLLISLFIYSLVFLWPIVLLIVTIGISYGIYDLRILKPKRIQAIRKSRVVKIDSGDFKYGIPIQVLEMLISEKKTEKSLPKTVVKVAIPYLKEDGSAEISESTVELEKVKPIYFQDLKANSNLNNLANISSTVKQCFKIKQEEYKLERQYLKATEIATMVKQSKIYASQLNNYERLLLQIESLLEKSHNLQSIYFDIIKENLLFYKIASSSSELVPEGLHFSFDARHKQAEEEYQYLKDTVSAYFDLLEENMTKVNQT